MKPVLVIGGGVSGLSTGVALARRGLPVTVLEASDRPGGQVRTQTADGFQLEAGPYALFDFQPALRDQLAFAGLEDRVQRGSPVSGRRFLALHGGLRLIPAGPKILTSGPLSLGARMRLLMEVVTSRPTSDDETMMEFGRRHVGDEAARVLLEPFVGLLYAGDVHRLSAKSCFPALHELEQRHHSLVRGLVEEYREGKRAGDWLPVGGNLISFPRGLQELPEALAARLGTSLRLGARVRGLSCDPSGVRLVLEGGEVLTGSAAVLAVPAPAAAELLESGAPAAATLLRQVTYAPLAVVHLAFSHAEVPADLDGFGFLVPTTEGLPVRGCIYTSSLFPGRAPEGQCLLSVLLGGARTPDLVVQPEDALVRLATSSVRRVLGISREPTFARVFTWPRAIPQYEVGTERRHTALRAELRRTGPVIYAGNAVGGAFLGDSFVRSAGLAEAIHAAVRSQAPVLQP